MAASDTQDEAYERISGYLGDLIGFFTGGSLDGDTYPAMRADLLRNPQYNGLAPTFLKRCRDTSALWSFAKSVDGSWEPRRQFLREQFEPLLDYLEGGAVTGAQQRMPGLYDASAWTGVSEPAQRARAVHALVPLAQAAIEALIAQLEAPGHNGGPPLDEIDAALEHLRKLHTSLGELLLVADEGGLFSSRGEGLMVEAARYGRRAAKALKNDPVPYALSATLLGLLTACGFPGIGGYLSGIAIALKKRD
ncbi:MAG: hypothetical protein J7499_10795 [Sphingopyxis sp.]|nr:hypothetical protein [Sphingopyxis sp.]